MFTAVSRLFPDASYGGTALQDRDCLRERGRRHESAAATQNRVCSKGRLVSHACSNKSKEGRRGFGLQTGNSSWGHIGGSRLVPHRL